jgi:hypothetical protein
MWGNAPCVVEDDLSAEHRQADKELSSGRAPIEILKRYEKWKDIAMLSGPQGSRAIKGFRDETLSGDWKGCRSSQRLADVLRHRERQAVVRSGSRSTAPKRSAATPRSQ